MKKIIVMVALSTSVLGMFNLAAGQGGLPASPVGHFELTATYQVSGEVAEIVAATPDGRTLVYTDSASEKVGFVDISDPASPTEITTIAVAGEPTSERAVEMP